jgi:hypothetical protein
MKLPLNGRVVIIDDMINEAQPLIKILSKRRIPFNYYKGTDYDEFPENPNENKLRTLFLDLNIFELNKDTKTVISALDPILRTFVPDYPNPYLLIIWSKQSNEYQEALEKYFETHLRTKKPAKIIFLQKNDYFDFDTTLGWLPQAGAIEKIEADLNSKLDQISLLTNLITWENIVHQKASDTLSEFATFCPFDKNWDQNSKAIMFQLAKAVVGADNISTLNDEQKLSKAFLNVNSLLAEKIESEVNSLRLGSVNGIIDKAHEKDPKIDSVPDSVKAAINSKLHILVKPFVPKEVEQGNLYILPKDVTLVERIVWPKIFSPENPNKLEEIRNEATLVQLDITPACDYAQDKNYARLLLGVLIKPENGKYFKTQYYSKTPIFNINDEIMCIIFDFRQILSCSREELIAQNLTPLFKFRKEICTDIQAQLSNQVNRPGIGNL